MMGVRTGDMVIRIYGEPRPWPQKLGGGKRKRMGAPTNDDFRTRTNQYTGKKERWDRGYKMRWFGFVRTEVVKWMIQHGRKPFIMNHPIALGALVFVTKPKTGQLKFPTGTPDLDNLRYGIYNALKRTPDVKAGKISGAYPDGVAFHDDSQIIWTAQPDGMLWATEANPPGALITIIDLLDRPDMMEWGRTIDRDVVTEDRV